MYNEFKTLQVSNWIECYPFVNQWTMIFDWASNVSSLKSILITVTAAILLKIALNCSLNSIKAVNLRYIIPSVSSIKCTFKKVDRIQNVAFSSSYKNEYLKFDPDKMATTKN